MLLCLFSCVQLFSFSSLSHAMKWYMFSWTEVYFGLPYLFTFCMIVALFFLIGKH